MRRYAAGTHVRGGLYLDPTTGRTAVIPRSGGRLEGADTWYVRVAIPLPLALLLAPLAGALYVIALPLIGLGWMAVSLCRWIWNAQPIRRAAAALFAAPRARPGWGFLMGGRRPAQDSGPKNASGPESKATKETP